MVEGMGDVVNFNQEETTENEASCNEHAGGKRRVGPFERLGLESFMVRAVTSLGFKLPTPIQRRTIPLILQGRDVVAMARTGSGKTAAFLLPSIQRLKGHQTSVGIRCLIFEPTRELAFQVAKVARQLSRFTDLRLCVIVGGSAMENQFERLASNPDLVVGCPGRLLHHIVESGLALSATEIVIFDEADQMFELGLGEQLQQILQSVNATRQCILMSATLPASLVEFARVGLRSPEFIRLDLEQSLSPTLDIWFLYTRTEDKLAALLFLLREVLLHPNPELEHEVPPGVIVFVASRHHVEFLSALLEKAGVPNSVGYGAMDLQARVESLANFRKGHTKVLVVTDVAARGLDIPAIGTVINFDFPVSPKHFIHRVGRTARAGKRGLALSLITRDEMAYAIELLLFSGLKLDLPEELSREVLKTSKTALHSIIATDALEKSHTSFEEFLASKQKRPPLYIGSVPRLADDAEFVRQCLESPEFEGLYRVMTRSYIQYNKIRRPASKQSIRRAKQLLGGDASVLLNCVHPRLRSYAVNTSTDNDAILQALHAVRPKSTASGHKKSRQGGVLPAEVVTKMRTLQFSRQLTNFSVQQPEDVPTGGMLFRPVDSKNLPGPCNSFTRATSDASDSANESKESEADVNVDDVFDWKSYAAKHNSQQFFLTEEHAAETAKLLNVGASCTEAPKDGLQAMQAAQFDLLPDNDREQRKTLHVRKYAVVVALRHEQLRWNAQKKKYVMTPVDAVSGKVLGNKQVKRRNEAGVIVRGELQKTGVYEKWMKQTRLRIQRVGEVEDPQYTTKSRQSRRSSDSSSSDDDTPLPPLSSLTKDEGLVEAIESGAALTHKQQRKAKKLLAAQRGTIRRGSTTTVDEVRSARQLAKVKKDTYKNKLRHNAKLRAAASRKSKEKHMQKRQQQGAAKAARPRSFVVPKKTRKHHGA